MTKTKPRLNFQKILAFLTSIKSKATNKNLADQRIKSNKIAEVWFAVLFIDSMLENKVIVNKAMSVYSLDIFIFRRLDIQLGIITTKSNRTYAKKPHRFSYPQLR